MKKILIISSNTFYKEIPKIKEKLEEKGYKVYLTDSYKKSIGWASNEKEQKNSRYKSLKANRRKIIESLIYDVRIFIIKLADRLHNMKTLEFHTPEKQKEIARETMELFVPFASLLGEFKVKCELEDLCFQYLDPEEFNLTKMRVDNFVNSLEFLMEERIPQH